MYYTLAPPAIAELSTPELLEEIRQLENAIEYTTCFDQHPAQGKLLQCYAELDQRSCTAAFQQEYLRGEADSLPVR